MLRDVWREPRGTTTILASALILATGYFIKRSLKLYFEPAYLCEAGSYISFPPTILSLILTFGSIYADILMIDILTAFEISTRDLGQLNQIKLNLNNDELPFYYQLPGFLLRGQDSFQTIGKSQFVVLLTIANFTWSVLISDLKNLLMKGVLCGGDTHWFLRELCFILFWCYLCSNRSILEYFGKIIGEIDVLNSEQRAKIDAKIDDGVN